MAAVKLELIQKMALEMKANAILIQLICKKAYKCKYMRWNDGWNNLITASFSNFYLQHEH